MIDVFIRITIESFNLFGIIINDVNIFFIHFEVFQAEIIRPRACLWSIKQTVFFRSRLSKSKELAKIDLASSVEWYVICFVCLVCFVYLLVWMFSWYLLICFGILITWIGMMNDIVSYSNKKISPTWES